MLLAVLNSPRQRLHHNAACHPLGHTDDASANALSCDHPFDDWPLPVLDIDDAGAAIQTS